MRSSLHLPVVSSSPDDASSFWLLAAFSRSRIHISDSSVANILHSILGGVPSLFAVIEIEDHIFKFIVASKSVGLLIYHLRSFECDLFKIFFHLWNDKGINFARGSTLTDRGPSYQRQEVKANHSKKFPHLPKSRMFTSVSSQIYLRQSPKILFFRA